MREDDGKDFPGHQRPCARTTASGFPAYPRPVCKPWCRASSTTVALAHGRASCRVPVGPCFSPGRREYLIYTISKCASTVRIISPLIGSMSCGQAENATIRSISARSST